MYYSIPASKQSKSVKKLAALAANLQISTWKNNSSIVLYNQSGTDTAYFVDVRLHMIIENIYLQVLIICEKNRVYEIDCFKDDYDKNYFDKITAAIKGKGCPG
jgi:hypothetical protein